MELWLNLIGRFIVSRLLGECHRVNVGVLVTLQFIRTGVQHVVEVGQVIAISILLIDREVWHLLICYTQQVTVILLVLGIGHVEVGHNLDAVTYKVVKGYTGGETIKFLLNHRTSLMVITTCNAEVGFLTTT